MDAFKRGSQFPNDNAVHQEHWNADTHLTDLQVTTNSISLAERFWQAGMKHTDRGFSSYEKDDFLNSKVTACLIVTENLKHSQIASQSAEKAKGNPSLAFTEAMDFAQLAE